jgi:hypothetical protein
MSLTALRLAAGAFFLAYLLAVTWPVGTRFAGATPFVFGLPFSLFWAALWIVLGFGVLLLLDRAEVRAERQATGEAAGHTPDPAPDQNGDHPHGGTRHPAARTQPAPEDTP